MNPLLVRYRGFRGPRKGVVVGSVRGDLLIVTSDGKIDRVAPHMLTVLRPLGPDWTPGRIDDYPETV